MPRAYAGARRLLYPEDTVADVRLSQAILRSRPSVRLLPAMIGASVSSRPVSTFRI